MARTFRGGVHPDEMKDATRKKALEAIPAPPTVTIPMLLHIGAPCEPVVAVGDHVKLGQVIGRSGAAMPPPIHASVSGLVKAIEPRLHPNGSMVKAVVIENDFNNTLDDSISPKGTIESLSAEAIIAIVKEAGIVGLGGAAFPTHMKISSGLGLVNTIIINAAECEPYITSGHRGMLENTGEIIGGIRLLMKATGIQNAIIGIEANKPDAVAAFEAQLPKRDSDIRLRVLKTKYPQGGEKQLVEVLTGRRVPPGGLPSAVGCAVYNTDTCAAVFRAVVTGMPLVTRNVTVAGSAIANPKNLIVPIGTPLADLVTAAGGFKDEPDKMLMGGPMMGIALTTLDIPVIKATNAFLAFCENEDKTVDEPICIRCGRCISACPMHLMPQRMYHCYDKGMFDELDALNVSDCIECGACTYICPGRLHLTQSFHIGKKRVAQYKKERGGN